MALLGFPFPQKQRSTDHWLRHRSVRRCALGQSSFTYDLPNTKYYYNIGYKALFQSEPIKSKKTEVVSDHKGKGLVQIGDMSSLFSRMIVTRPLRYFIDAKFKIHFHITLSAYLVLSASLQLPRICSLRNRSRRVVINVLQYQHE